MPTTAAFVALLFLGGATAQNDQPRIWAVQLSFAGASLRELDGATALVAAEDTEREVLIRAAQHGYLIVEPDLRRVFLGATFTTHGEHLVVTVLLEWSVGERRAGQVVSMLQREPIAIRIGVGSRRVPTSAVSGPVSMPIACGQDAAGPGLTVAVLLYNLPRHAVTVGAVQRGLADSAELVAEQFSTPRPTVIADRAAWTQAGSTVLALVEFGPGATAAAAALRHQVSVGNVGVGIIHQPGRLYRIADTAAFQDTYVLVAGSRGCCRMNGAEETPPTREYESTRAYTCADPPSLHVPLPRLSLSLCLPCPMSNAKLSLTILPSPVVVTITFPIKTSCETIPCMSCADPTHALALPRLSVLCLLR